jgi:excisionase family DNA binding protein
MTAPQPRLSLSRREAAEAVGYSKETIARAIRSGALRAKRSGKDGNGKDVILVEDLQAWLDSLEDA